MMLEQVPLRELLPRAVKAAGKPRPLHSRQISNNSLLCSSSKLASQRRGLHALKAKGIQ